MGPALRPLMTTWPMDHWRMATGERLKWSLTPPQTAAMSLDLLLKRQHTDNGLPNEVTKLEGNTNGEKSE